MLNYLFDSLFIALEMAEAVRPCFLGVSEQSPWMGQKVHKKEWKRDCAKVSIVN